MAKKLAYREGIGDLLADGVKKASQKLGKGSEEFAIHMKGQDSVDAYRVFKGWGFGLSTSPVAGRHLRGSVSSPSGMGPKKGLEWSTYEYENIPDVVFWQARTKEIEDMTGICSYVGTWAGTRALEVSDYAALISSAMSIELTEEELTRAQYPLSLSSITLDETGQVSEEQGGLGVFIVPYVFGLLLIMAIFTSSGFLLQGLGEEKENRIMEILLSSVSPRQLITGKVLGLGAAGLLQILVWVTSAQLLVVFGSSAIGGFFSDIQIPDGFFLLAPIYFILGYLLFAVLMAGIGAFTNTSREGQQMSTIFVMPAMLPFILQVFLIENPTHIVSQLLTFFPLTAPIAVIIRLGSTNIPVWELIVSIALMVAAIIGAIWFSAKIFRTFLLMYGKTPKFSEILRSLRQA